MNTSKLKKMLQTTLNEMGYSLIKSTARKWSFDNQCGYMIRNDAINTCVAGRRFELSLDDVQSWLAE